MDCNSVVSLSLDLGTQGSSELRPNPLQGSSTTPPTGILMVLPFKVRFNTHKNHTQTYLFLTEGNFLERLFPTLTVLSIANCEGENGVLSNFCLLLNDVIFCCREKTFKSYLLIIKKINKIPVELYGLVNL